MQLNGSIRSIRTWHRGCRQVERPCLKAYAESVRVAFQVSKQVPYGDSIKLAGSGPALGDWSLDDAPEMRWNDGDVWTVDVELPADATVYFKYVCVNGSSAYWEECKDHSVQLPAASIQSSWNGDVDVHSSARAAANTKESDEAQVQPAVERSDHPTGSLAASDGRLAHNQWQGADVVFMHSNNHSKERSGHWDTSGLQGAALHIVSSDEKAANWLAKLEAVKALLVDKAPDQKPDLDALAAAYVYLQWINTGTIRCVEGGGHYRPNRHAELSRVIFRWLERVVGDPDTADIRSLLARRMHPKLPSFTEAYTASVPFTRIRDIAHRGDIPHDLKQEIKHTIQNKLHRNAGPEDLVATERLLERLESDGNYPGEFMHQLRIFLSELRDFFNASSLTDMLQALRPSLDDSNTPAVDSFMKAKSKLDAAGPGASLNDVLDVLHSLTTVRAVLSGGLAAGLRNDAPASALAMRQRWRLAEGRCDDYAFVLLSQVNNVLQAQGGGVGLLQGGDKAWALPLGAAVLAVRHIGLSAWCPAECAAIENELTTWQRYGEFADRDNALRLRATLERAQHLTQSYTDELLGVLPKTAEALGNAMGIAREQIAVFTEAEIRTSVVFQLSGLLSLLLNGARTAAGCDAWDAIVGGVAVGRLQEASSLEDAEALADGSTVLLLRGATGDEDVSACDGALKGLILCHSLPHLSHLGVRARQQGLPLVTVDDADYVAHTLRPLLGRQVQLTSSASGVHIVEHSSQTLDASGTAARQGDTKSSAPITAASKRTTEASVIKASKFTWLPLSEAMADTCGAKAATCAALEGAAGSLFETPRGIAFPFGSMELALKDAASSHEFHRLLDRLETAARKDVDNICSQLEELVGKLRIPASILQEAGKHLDCDRVYVRSSANVEDLEGMSGAGLYDSVPFVDCRNINEFGAAVAHVWASLFTRRAVLTRRAAGVRQSQASMAVFAMEMLSPETSFVLHTASPLERDEAMLHAEVAPGLGETLASGARGTAWHFAVDKASGKTSMLSFANFSKALMASKASSADSRSQLMAKTVDYSCEKLSKSEAGRHELSKRLCDIGVALEKKFGCPQDVEGAIAAKRIFIVQSRPQP